MEEACILYTAEMMLFKELLVKGHSSKDMLATVASLAMLQGLEEEVRYHNSNKRSIKGNPTCSTLIIVSLKKTLETLGAVSIIM